MRPADRVLDQAGLGAARRELPQFLDAEAVGLGLPAVGEAEAGGELLGDAAARAFGEEGRAGADVGARRVVRPGLALAVEAHVADAHAHDAVALDQGLRRREAGEDVHAERLGARGEDLCKLAQRDDDVAAVVHLRRIRQARGAGLRVVPELVAGRGHADVRRRLAPAGQQGVERTRLERAAGDQVGADRGGFLQHADAAFGLEFLEADGGGEPCGAGADDNDVVLHDVTLHDYSLFFISLHIHASSGKSPVSPAGAPCAAQPQST